MNSKQTPTQCFFKPEKYFRMLFPKSSSLSPWMLSLLSNFESSLTARLKKLVPQNKDEILTLPWMILAMSLICETHNDMYILLTDLKLDDMITDVEHRDWVDVYLDTTVKLLDLCNAFSYELNRINTSFLCLRCLSHDLELKSEEQCIAIRSILDSWRQNVTTKKVEHFSIILEGFVESLNFAKVKNFPEVNVFMKAFYAANVLTAYICSVFVTIWSDSDKDLLHITVLKQSLWKKTFLDLQTVVNTQIRDETMVLKELECVDAKVKKMYLITQDGDNLVQESFKESIVELKEEVKKLDHGLDELLRKLQNFFSVTLKGRNTIG